MKDFLVRFSNKTHKDYIPIDIEKENNVMVRILKKMFGIGNCYKPMFPVQKIKDFIIALKTIENVSLFIYTSLHPTIANAILTRLQLHPYFPETHRRYCVLENNDDQKHAIQVDEHTHRVIIITPTSEDHTQEDEKYFLILKPKPQDINFLKKSFRTVKDFIE